MNVLVLTKKDIESQQKLFSDLGKNIQNAKESVDSKPKYFLDYSTERRYKEENGTGSDKVKSDNFSENTSNFTYNPIKPAKTPKEKLVEAAQRLMKYQTYLRKKPFKFTELVAFMQESDTFTKNEETEKKAIEYCKEIKP